MPAADPDSNKAMSSTLRCLEILEVLAYEPYALSLSQIADGLSVARSSAHRFLCTLIVAGLVSQNPTDKRYKLAGKALWVGTAYLRDSRLYRCSLPIMENLSQKTKMMSHLAIWDCDTVLYLHTMGPARSPNLFTDSGSRGAVHATALGKLLLAYRPIEDIKRIFAQGVKSYTKNTVTSFPSMKKELAQIRELRYSLDNEEGTIGLRCLAAPILDQAAHVIAALSVSGRSESLPNSKIPQTAQLVQEAALRTSAQLGYRPAINNLYSFPAPLMYGNESRDNE